MGDNCCMAHEGVDFRLKSAEENIGKLDMRFDHIDNRVIKLEKNTALDMQRLTLVLENVSESLPKLANAIEKVETTMVSMQSEIKESNKKTDDIQKQLNDLDKKVCSIDDEGKFNIRTYIKSNLPKVITAITALGGGAALGYFVR